MKQLVYPAMALFVTGAVALTPSCKKKETPKQVCKIQKLSTDNEEYVFSYDDQFRISKIESMNKVANYSYNGNQSTILTTTSGTFNSKRIITTNDAGLIQNVKTESNTNGSIWTNEAYTYNGNQVATSVSTASNGQPANTTNYVWTTDGNLGTVISGSGATTDFTYQADQTFQEGDFAHVLNMVLNGYTFYKTKNLVKSISPSTDISYNFDTDNKINKVTAGPAVIQVTYICK